MYSMRQGRGGHQQHLSPKERGREPMTNEREAAEEKKRKEGSSISPPFHSRYSGFARTHIAFPPMKAANIGGKMGESSSVLYWYPFKAEGRERGDIRPFPTNQ